MDTVIPYLDLKRLHQDTTQWLPAATAALQSGWFLRGEQTRLFEQEYAAYIGTEHCVGCGNGLDALTLILRAYKELGHLHDGDEVIVPANTYIASILSITENGLAPILVEPDWNTLQIDDSLFVTAVNYCNHLYTIHLHSTAADDPTVSSQFFWMISNKWFIANNTFLPYLGQDSTTLRIVGSIEGNPDTVVLDYRPAQLLGKEPAIDVDLAGQYLAMVLGRECPQPLDDSTGVWTHCSYDPSLKVVVMHYTVDELSILANEGKEQQLKPMLLEHLIYADGAEFLGLLASSEVGLELRWQSRTTARKFTITFTADELINYMFEEE